MPRKEKKCHCEDRIKVLEENLLLLQNLMVKGNVLIEGDLIVKGRITDEKGGVPDFGQGETCVAVGSPRTFNINTPQPACRIITQGQVIGSSRVNFGPLTNGLFTLDNRSLFFTIDVYDLGTSGIVAPVYQVKPSALVKITFTNGVITAIEEPIPV